MNSCLILMVVVTVTAAPGISVHDGLPCRFASRFWRQVDWADWRQSLWSSTNGRPACLAAGEFGQRAARGVTQTPPDRSPTPARTRGAILYVLMMVIAGLPVCACIGVIYVVARTGSVRSGEVSGNSNTAVPGWPRRRDYLLLALLFAAIAICGSLVPFRFAPLEISEAIERLKEILDRPIRPGSRSNLMANVLLFVPIGYCFLAVFAVDRRKRVLTMLCVPLAILMCAGLSVAAEFAQLWFPQRVPSLTDIVAQTIGAVAGVGLWLTIGQTITDWVRSYSIFQRPKDQIDWLLQAYFIGLLVYSVLPLDLTLSPAQFFHKYRQGGISLVPFSDVGWGFATFYALFRDLVIFTPVGMLAATWMTSPGRPVRPIVTSVLLGGLVVVTVEMAQLFVFSRSTATGDLIGGTLGVCVGAWMMHRWRGGGQVFQPKPGSSGFARRAWLWLGLAGVYSLFLAVIFCAPFQPIDDLQEIKARLGGFLRLPFASYYGGLEFHLVSEIFKKGLFFAPLGGLLALAVVPLPVPRPIRRILLAIALLAAVGVAASIEMAQVFLPPHVPSSTDVILCAIGAATGIFVTVRIVDARRAPP